MKNMTMVMIMTMAASEIMKTTEASTYFSAQTQSNLVRQMTFQDKQLKGLFLSQTDFFLSFFLSVKEAKFSFCSISPSLLSK